MAEHTTIKVSCLCNLSQTSLSIPNSSLPLTAILCHCNTSRHVSGLLYTSYASLPSAPSNLPTLTEYKTSPDLSRFFCPRCGTHLFGHHLPTDTWKLATGVLDKSEGVVKFDSHMWVGDTLDGGISDWLHELDEWPLVRWEKGKGSSERLPPGPITRSREGGRRRWTGDERLQAKCQCGGVEFSISPPNDESSNASSPWSDLLVPYHTAPPDNPDDVKWWLRDEGTRYLAGTCACASCRLASGFDIQAWAFIPKVNILHVDGRPFDFRTETLEQHESSNSTVREFCRVCGATVFWRREDRAELIDVSVGLLRTESGVRAEEWLDWCVGRVSFAEEGLNQKLIQALTKGLEAWREGVPPSI